MTTQPSTLRPTPQPSPPIAEPNLFALRVIIALFLIKAVGIVLLVVLIYLDNSALLAELQLDLTAEEVSPLAVTTYIILAPLNVLAAIGLWRRKRWAWILTMALLAYSMTLDLASYFRGQALYVSMTLNVIQVGYLNQQEVQNLFAEKDKRKAL